MTKGTLQKVCLAVNETLDASGVCQVTPLQKGATLSFEVYDGDEELYSSIPVTAGTFFLDASAKLVNRSAGNVRIGYAAIEEEVAE